MSVTKTRTNPLGAVVAHPIAGSTRNQLIPIFIEENREVVDARTLWGFLHGSSNLTNVKATEFSHWIQRRIRDYGFKENHDWTSFKKILKTTRGRRTEYTISLDMAKELAMVERNERGRQARQYFIECERKLRSLSADEVLLLDAYRKQKAMLEGCRKIAFNGETWYCLRDVYNACGKTSHVDYTRKRHVEQCMQFSIDGKAPLWYCTAKLADLVISNTQGRRRIA